MFKLFSFILLAGSLFGGFVLAKGTMSLLWHPYELLMIFGPALSCFLIANSPKVAKDTLSQLKYVFVSLYTKEYYQESLLLMFELTRLYKEKGNIELEKHIDEPNESPIFQKYPRILKHQTSVTFIADNLRLVTNGKFQVHDIDDYIEAEIDSYFLEASKPSKALDQITDFMPSLGIVVAVLGIIITMQFIDATPEILGQHISAALFGTFVGVFMAYGVIAPMSKAIEGHTHRQRVYFEVLKSNILSIVHGYSPHVAVEIARKSIPPSMRASGNDIEEAIKEIGKS